MLFHTIDSYFPAFYPIFETERTQRYYHLIPALKHNQSGDGIQFATMLWYIFLIGSETAPPLAFTDQRARNTYTINPGESALFSITEILDIAIRIELNGESVYRNATRHVSDATLASALHQLADDEHRHAGWFRELQKSAASRADNPFAEQIARELFDDMMGQWSFLLDETDFSQIQSLTALTRIAIEFERDTILFYEMIATFVEDDATREELQSIIAEEQNHIRRLTELNDLYMSAAPAS